MKTSNPTVSAEVHVDSEQILDQWHDLADRVGTVFSSRPSFVRSVARSTGAECEYVVVVRNGRVSALAPLSIKRRGPVKLATIIGANLGVPLELLSADTESTDALFTAIAARGCMLSADSLIANQPAVDRLRLHPSWTVAAEVRERVPVIDVPAGRGASHIRGSKSLKRLERYRRRIADESSLKFEVITDVAHLDARWHDITSVAADAVHGTDKVNYLVPPHGGFARDFLRAEARAGRLYITGLVVDGVWTAHEIDIRTGNRLEGWLTHYDARVSQLQPGHQLTRWFADNHDDLGVVHLDRGVGVNDIKSVWAKSGYDVLKVSAVPSAWALSRFWTQALRYYSPTVSYLRDTALSGLSALRSVGGRSR